MGDVERLTAEVERLAAQVEALTAALSKDIASPYGKTIIHEKRGFTYGTNPAEPRRVIDYRSKNTKTNTVFSCDGFTAIQLERAAYKFAKLETPTRSKWHGKRELYGIMRHLFAQHAGIVRHHGLRVWRWAVWPHQRREIAARIVASFAK
jgi:hypothetical protein